MKYFTHCAQSKLLRLIAESGATSAKITFLNGKIALSLRFTPAMAGDIMMLITPRIYTDLSSLQDLVNHKIDFDYSLSKFIITREKYVIPLESKRRKTRRNCSITV